ncbi:MAG: hypothetical protein LQ340_005497 [Diploschistes diacapsis]|nr:MAG: hypothetical protein LQ340_005497 [Diploschistes diacapsis]
MVIDKPHPDATDGGAANGDGDTGLENIGYLIIRPSDEEAWEVFLSDSEGSDEEEWEGEDDSNAEDYYGNDYPEEEEDWVGSDYGAGSEYGSEDGRWSDEGGR